MSSDCFHLAAEGWRIISTHDDPRESARILLRQLVEAMDLSAIGVAFREDGGYSWQERVGRFTAIQKEPKEIWERPFPKGLSRWVIEGCRESVSEFEPLLDLLANQWLHLAQRTKSFSGKSISDRRRTEPRYSEWTAVSRSSRIVNSRLPQLCSSRQPVLLVGENGTGRRHIASLIHNNSPYAAEPFSTIEEKAGTGTLFVPEWKECGQEKTAVYLADPRRLIVATVPGSSAESLRKTWSDLTEGRGVTLSVPALRERKEDIPHIAGRFLDEFCVESGRKTPELTTGILEILKSHYWPGNIRELRECMTWVFDHLKDDTAVGSEHLPPAIRSAVGTETSFPERITALEYEALKRELSRQRGNMTRTAQALGLTPRQVSWRVRKYGIDPRAFKPQHRMD